MKGLGGDIYGKKSKKHEAKENRIIELYEYMKGEKGTITVE